MTETLFVIDEAATVLRGGMPAVEEALVMGRASGIRLGFFWQSVGQLQEALKGKEAVLLDNCDTIWFGLKGIDSATHVSKLLGEQTITVESAKEKKSQWGHGTDAYDRRSYERSWSEQARSLLKPDEVLNLSPDYVIAFLRGVRPIICRRVKWYQEREFGGIPRRRPLSLMWWMLMVGALGLVVWAFCK